jgi:hypothetical protein
MCKHQYKVLHADGAKCSICGLWLDYGEWRDIEISNIKDLIYSRIDANEIKAHKVDLSGSTLPNIPRVVADCFRSLLDDIEARNFAK